MRIGVLALQGAFDEHISMLGSLGCESVQLRKKEDIKDLDGIVLPGGESTVQGKLLRELDMFDTMRELILDGTPTLATCAGLILLAERLCEHDYSHLATLPVTVRRNAYGRHLESFQTIARYEGIGDVEMTFIRAPYIENAGSAQVLATVEGKIVAVRYGAQIGLSFHPELGSDDRIHRSLLDLISARRGR